MSCFAPLVSFYLLLFFLFTITDTVAYSTGEPYRGVVCEGTTVECGKTVVGQREDLGHCGD